MNKELLEYLPYLKLVSKKGEGMESCDDFAYYYEGKQIEFRPSDQDPCSYQGLNDVTLIIGTRCKNINEILKEVLQRLNIQTFKVEYQTDDVYYKETGKVLGDDTLKLIRIMYKYEVYIDPSCKEELCLECC